MSMTPTKFTGTPKLTPAKLDTMKRWYLFALGKADKATNFTEKEYYTVQADVIESILYLLHTDGWVQRSESLNVVSIAKKNKSLLFNKKFLIIVGIVIMLDGRLPKKAKNALFKKYPPDEAGEKVADKLVDAISEKPCEVEPCRLRAGHTGPHYFIGGYTPTDTPQD